MVLNFFPPLARMEFHFFKVSTIVVEDYINLKIVGKLFRAVDYHNLKLIFFL